MDILERKTITMDNSFNEQNKTIDYQMERKIHDFVIDIHNQANARFNAIIQSLKSLKDIDPNNNCDPNKSYTNIEYLLDQKFKHIKIKLENQRLKVEAQLEKQTKNKKINKLKLKLKHLNHLLEILDNIKIIILKILTGQGIYYMMNDDKTQLDLKNKFNNLVKQLIQFTTKYLSSCLFKEDRKYRIYFTPIKHIGSGDDDKSNHLILMISVFNSSKRHKITFKFSKILTAINRLKKDDGEISNDILQYWPSSKYRKKRIFETNHRINCLLQTQFCIRQTLSNFYPSYEFSVSRIC
ncbi:MAG: hypothetical protein AB4057_22390 [Crocosphaera sp.]